MEAFTLLIGDDAEAYDIGLMAFDDGMSIEDNPYTGNLAHYWAIGFKDASEEG